MKWKTRDYKATGDHDRGPEGIPGPHFAPLTAATAESASMPLHQTALPAVGITHIESLEDPSRAAQRRDRPLSRALGRRADRLAPLHLLLFVPIGYLSWCR